MFSEGQQIFALVFILLFVAGMVYAYRKDIAKNRNYFKGTYKIILIFIAIYLLFVLLHKLL